VTLVPLERRRLSDAAVNQILELIRSGELSVGAKLPSERELAREFGVSRVLVRESLRTLEALGVIEVRTGVGAFVAAQSPVNAQIASYLRRHPAEVLEVVEVRTGIASLTGELAARRLSDQELAELDRLVAAQHEAAACCQPERLPKLDEEFHEIIYRGTHNHLLISMQEYTRGVLDHIQWNHITLLTRTNESLREHERILDSLRKRDPRAASAALRRHAQRSNADIRRFVENFGEQVPGTS
jgi:GntR family transcriptional repressor for pyruvate dehydrogenase complex